MGNIRGIPEMSSTNGVGRWVPRTRLRSHRVSEKVELQSESKNIGTSLDQHSAATEKTSLFSLNCVGIFGLSMFEKIYLAITLVSQKSIVLFKLFPLKIIVS